MGTPVARQFYRKYPGKTLAIVVVDGPLTPFVDKQMVESFIATFRGPNYKEAGAGMLAAMLGPSMTAEKKERLRMGISRGLSDRRQPPPAEPALQRGV